MPHTIEPALSGRSRCRGCGQSIAKDTLRFGESVPNPFSDDGDTTVWFHLDCGALRRPEAFLEGLEGSETPVEDADRLTVVARQGVELERLVRIDGVELSSSGRASCRGCREKIDKGAWRIRLSVFDDARFTPAGFLHVACSGEYFGTSDIADRLERFTPDLAETELAEVVALLD